MEQPAAPMPSIERPAGRLSLRRTMRHVRTETLLRYEAVTIGFYVCVTLFAAMSAGRDLAAPPLGELVALIWLTTVGLALAHWFAATIAGRLVPDVLEHHATSAVLLAHLVVPVAVAAATSIVVLLVPADVKMLAGRLTAAAGLAMLVAVESGNGRRTTAQRLGLAVLAFGCAAGIAVVKRLVF